MNKKPHKPYPLTPIQEHGLNALQKQVVAAGVVIHTDNLDHRVVVQKGEVHHTDSVAEYGARLKKITGARSGEEFERATQNLRPPSTLIDLTYIVSRMANDACLNVLAGKAVEIKLEDL